MKRWFEKWQSIITLILFLATAIGWFVDSRVNRKVLKIQLEDVSKDVEFAIEALRKQENINGKVIMYIQLDSNIDIDEKTD